MVKKKSAVKKGPVKKITTKKSTSKKDTRKKTSPQKPTLKTKAKKLASPKKQNPTAKVKPPIHGAAKNGTLSRSAPTHAVKQPDLVAVPLQERDPRRQVMRSDRTIETIAPRLELVADLPAAAAIVEDLPSAQPPDVEVAKPAQKPEFIPETLPRAAWSNLPSNYPAQQRFYLSMAEKECRAAAEWPFPFARFIAALPEQMCARGMALLLLALEHPASYIAKLLNESEQAIDYRLAHERDELLDRCSALCPEMLRKLKTQLGGVGISIEMLIEKYLVSRVDRNFQLTVGAVILQALSH